jgi:hypothetical protein
MHPMEIVSGLLGGVLIGGAASGLLFLGLLEIVWRNFQRVAVETPLPQGFGEFSEAQKLGMNWRWEECGGW